MQVECSLSITLVTAQVYVPAQDAITTVVSMCDYGNFVFAPSTTLVSFPVASILA